MPLCWWMWSIPRWLSCHQNFVLCHSGGDAFLESGSPADREVLVLEEGRAQIRADSTGADLGGANLAGANLTGVPLTGASFDGTNLSRANLAGVDLHNANPGVKAMFDHGGGVSYKHTNLTHTNLANANFAGADLAGADLRGADLRGVKLADTASVSSIGSRLRTIHFRARLRGAISDQTPNCPPA